MNVVPNTYSFISDSLLYECDCVLVLQAWEENQVVWSQELAHWICYAT